MKETNPSRRRPGGLILIVLPLMTVAALLAGSLVFARTNPEETPEYCKAQYDKCLADCAKDPLNKTTYDLEACRSSCYSTFSGCGM